MKKLFFSSYHIIKSFEKPNTQVTNFSLILARNLSVDQPSPEASADYTYRDLDYSGQDQKTGFKTDRQTPLFSYCFIIHCIMEYIQKLLCGK